MRTSQFLEDMTRFLMNNASFKQFELAAELATKRGAKNLEAPLSIRLAGKAKHTEVLEGIEMLFYDRVVEDRIPFSYFQRLIDAQRIYDRTIGITDKTQLQLHIERGAYLDDVAGERYPKASVMKRLLKGVDGAIEQLNSGADPRVRYACANVAKITSTAEMLLTAVEDFKKLDPGQLELHPCDVFFMAYAGNMANWVISEIPPDAGYDKEINSLHSRLHTSGALEAMSKVAMKYGCGGWERLYNLAHAFAAVYDAVKLDGKVHNAPSILAQSVKVYAVAIQLNPRLANFRETFCAVRADVDDGEGVPYPVDGIDEPIGAEGALKPMLERLERENPRLLSQARGLIDEHRAAYVDDHRTTVMTMAKALAKLNRRAPVDNRKAAGAILAICVSIAAGWLMGNTADTTHVASKFIFPLVETVEAPGGQVSPVLAGKPVFPLQLAASKPVFPLERSAPLKSFEATV
jgi:hypothetical protein